MKSGLRFVCTIAGIPENTFAVGEFSLQEGLSELFTLNLTLVRAGNANPFKPQAEIDLAGLLMQEAVLQVFNGETEQRKITGIISHADWIGTDGNKTLYTLTVRPALWRLTLNQDSRIYHQQNVPAILKSLLQKHRVKADSKLYDTHQDREYVTQKRESDYAFFSRLAAEEGISFWFEDETAFFSDSHLGMTAGLPLQYQPQPETAYGVDTIYQVRLGVGMSPQRSLHKDYNPENPRYHLSHMHSSEGFRDFGSQTPYTVFESYGRFQKDAAAKPFLKYRQEALDNQKQTGSGNSNCIKLKPGKIFEIKSHPHKPLKMVVGPEGEEIFVNKDGAIKVHFHWNRYDAPDDGASCWVRVAQGWNGNGFGFMAIPRIGQEVIISYLNGDIDRPIVTGCVYNGLNRPPLDLPAAKTRTTFKTKTHKGKGFNELRFEDAKGSEEIYFHGQKDFTSHIENDAYWHIKHDQKSRIDNNRYHDIRADDHHQVAGSRKITTEGDVSHRIAGSQHTQTGDATVIDSGQEIHLKSGGKVVLEAASEITLKVGGSFLKVTPGGILCSPLNVGQGSGGSGRGVSLQLPEGVAPLAQVGQLPMAEALPVTEFSAKPPCAILAQQEENWVITGAEEA
ncbi:type VI secretion system tip protein VgrG [Xenorhabdus sp. XENO-1]|uniref:type VI secretion system Vgr family protein n=1 Tax=Xenorhabdus bovienii TaxID=40576 RepID=UPI0020CA33DB|nr:type VI secretion system tip protein TssI/VgrG [Xenorhabdus bovienii]MCP9270396.1 type VI secretion system tip protein VgrG [Xenorhabdus bovienii subsp. africana]